MAATSGKNGKLHVFEVSNRAAIQIINNTSLTTVADELALHKSSLNINAHQISNIAGLQDELDSKSDIGHTHNISEIIGLEDELDSKVDVFTGYTGVLNVVTFVDFPGEAVTTKTITISNGIVISVV